MTATVSSMNIMKLNLLGLIALTGTIFLVPTTVSAASLPYKPQTQLELISYMQGIVDTLQAQIAAGRVGGTASAGSSRVQTFTPIIAITTKIELKASFDAGSSTSVYAWFEYGEAGALNQKTDRTRLARVSGKVEHSATISNLKNGVVYSYRPVFELSGGSKYYGTVSTFGTAGTTTPGSTGSTATGTGGTASSANGTLTLSKTTYSLNDKVFVDFTIPASRVNDINWIGLYKVGASNSNPVYWNYLGNQTSGKFGLQIKVVGTYEYRLLNRKNQNEVLVSRRFTVR